MATPFSNGADFLQQRLQNLGNAQVASDAVTLGQVQAFLRGLDTKDPVRVATTAAITLSGLQTVDTIALAANDPVLVKNQAAAAQNGIWLAAAGAWVRRTDADENSEITAGFSVTVLEGANKGSTVPTANPLLYTLNTLGAVTVGTTALNFVPVGGSGVTYSAGNGLTLTSTTFSVVAKPGGGVVVDGTGVSVDTAVFTRDVWLPLGNGTDTSLTMTHNLGTLDYGIFLIEVATGQQWVPDLSPGSRTTNAVTFVFGVAPTANQFRAGFLG